ncbi:MAG: hypothetical protein ACYDBB_07565 [Armatimonadota bacterium]
MSISELSQPSLQRQRWTKTRRIAVIVFMIVSLLSLLNWWWPKSYKLAARYPSFDGTLISCTTGFVTRPNAGAFLFRDWQGKKCWQIRTPDGSAPCTFGISPDGRYFAAAVGINISVQLWRDGMPIGTVPLSERWPYNILDFLRLRVLNSGRVYCLWKIDKPCRGVVIDGTRITATGILPFYGTISPDGKALVAGGNQGFDYAALAIINGKLVVTRRYSGKHYFHLNGFYSPNVPEEENALFTGGVVLTSDGSIYDARGLRSASKKQWQHSTVSPGGTYTVEYQDTLGSGNSTARQGNPPSSSMVRIVNPTTGEVWSFSISNEHTLGFPSADGSHALVIQFTTLPTTLERVLTKLPMLKKRYENPVERAYLVLYNRKGQICGTLKISSLIRIIGENTSPKGLIISPTGQFMVISSSIGGDEKPCEYLLYRL